MKSWIAVALVASLGLLTACEKEMVAECKDPDENGPVPTCMAVCTHLYGLNCRVGSSEAECTQVCEGSNTITDFPKVMRCYQAAASCDDIDGCSRGCGPDASTVPFLPVTIGGDASNDQDGG